MRDGGGAKTAPGADPPWPRWLTVSALGVGLLLCFGVLGLTLWLLPSVRERRRQRASACRRCRRRQRVGGVTVAGLTAVLLLGAAVRMELAASPVDECSNRFTSGAEEVVAEEGPSLDETSPGWWGTARTAVTGPISGVMLVATGAAGMRHCSGSAVVVAFPPPPAPGGGGSVVGDVFVSWTPEAEGSGVALPGQESYVQFGSDTNADPEEVEAIARHESRHVDQWTVATLAGGPLVLPTAYYLDSLLFPLARNHFERAAGLSDGGYDEPSDFGPEPLWVPIAVTLGLALVLLRRRVRWSSRVLVGGLPAGRAHEEGRCPVHSRGWFRDGPRLEEPPLRPGRAKGDVTGPPGGGTLGP